MPCAPDGPLFTGSRSWILKTADQMGIPHETMIQLQAKGIASILDLVDFDNDSHQQLADNLC